MNTKNKALGSSRGILCFFLPQKDHRVHFLMGVMNVTSPGESRESSKGKKYSVYMYCTSIVEEIHIFEVDFCHSFIYLE